MPIIETSAKDPAGSVRPVAAVSAVPAISGMAAQSNLHGETSSDSGGSQHRQAASAADYVRAQSQIATIFADLNASEAAPTSLSDANDRVVALLPAPVVIIPLPPASADMVQRAIEVAQEMAEKAAMTRSAQANVGAGAVDALLASGD